MARLSATPIEYRHVVFPGDPADSGCAVDLGIRPADRLTPAPNNELSEDEYACAAWLFKKAGLQLSDYRPETIKRRLPAAMRAVRMNSLEQVCAAVLRQPDLLHPVLDALVIGVTSFFRDPPVFDDIDQEVLPTLLKAATSLHICSVGCSDGSELYSIAMLLARRDGLRQSLFWGIDVRSEAIGRAREGRFDLAAVKGIPNEVLETCFRIEPSSCRAIPEVRARMYWAVRNIVDGKEQMPLYDVILCRNLAIYLQPTVTERLWTQLARALRPGGFLILGKSERPTSSLGLTAVAPCIYRRD